MIEVTLVANSGAGIPCRIPVCKGTTLGKFLEVSFEGDPDEFKIRIRANGASVEGHADYILQNEDRISLTPVKVEGAQGPGTSAEQIKKLQDKLGMTGMEKATSIVDNHSPDEVTLAYKLMRTNVTRDKLPKSVSRLLENLSEEEASEIRSKLVEANANPIA